MCRFAVVDEITDVTRRLLCHRQAEAPAQVLIVEDDRDLRQLLRERLRSIGMVVRSASDGIRALRALRGWTPDVVITDWHMPNMDGVAFVRQMRGDDGLANIPVLFLTSDPGRRIEEECADLTGIAVLPKWTRWSDIRGRVESALSTEKPIA